ncbi:type IX secretion system protein PorD [Flavobacterium sp.]
MKKIIIYIFLLVASFTNAQQLNCTIQINTDKVASTNAQLFKNMKTTVTDFVNKTDWTGETLKQQEKINCSMVIIINSFEDNNFSASIQVQSTRPIFNSTYASPLFNYNDNDFGFRYTEFETILFNPSTFDSNLASVLAYYSYMILGFDGDTYALNGGTKNFEIAQQILTTAQQSGYKGWSQSDGAQNRFFLVNDMLSGTYDSYRDAQYAFHRQGLDLMTDDIKIAKENVMSAINLLAIVYSVRPNAFLTRVFFDAKADEIVSILSGGPNVSLATMIDTLNRISPINSSKWATIKL